MAVRFVLDCDSGSDDAIAVFAATSHPALELIAVTTVNGNVALEHVTDNTLRILDHVGAKVPVYAGAARPIARPDFPIPRAVLNADSGFQKSNLDFPEAVSMAERESAVSFLLDAYMDGSYADVALVATGPLTNVALALEAEPRLAERIPRLVIMGGAHANGNVTASAEFNFWVEPEAADAVLGTGIRDVVIVPLDATHSAPLSDRDCDEFDKIGTPAAQGTAMLIRHRIAHDQAAVEGTAALSAPVHDPMCVAYLVRPDIITEGVCERRNHGEPDAWRADCGHPAVALRASAEVYRDFLREAFLSTVC